MLTTTNIDNLTNQLWEAEQDGLILNTNGKIYIEYFDRDMDGIFANKASWTKFVNNVDNEGFYFLTKKLCYKNSDKRIICNNDKLIITYYNPIKVVTGLVLEDGIKKFVVSEVNSLTIKIDYVWYWKLGEQRASSLEVFGEMIDFS